MFINIFIVNTDHAEIESMCKAWTYGATSEALHSRQEPAWNCFEQLQ